MRSAKTSGTLRQGSVKGIFLVPCGGTDPHERTRRAPMRSFLNASSSTPKTGARQAATPKPTTPGSLDEVQIVSKSSLDMHGGRRGVPVEAGALAAILERYRDDTMGTAEKRAQSKGAMHVLSTMEASSTQLGDFSGHAGRGNSGNLAHLLIQLKKEVDAMRQLAGTLGKAEICAHEGGKKLRRLKEIVSQSMGQAQAHRLKTSCDGHIGKINSSLEHAHQAIVEEASLKLLHAEVIADRYDFATLKLPELRKLRDE